MYVYICKKSHMKMVEEDKISGLQARPSKYERLCHL